MFLMTHDIKIGGFKAFKCNSFTYESSMDEISDKATILIPAMCRLIDQDKTYNNLPTGLQIKEGQAVEIKAGYDGRNVTRFMGFVSRINFKVPVEIECEGYAYLLRRKMINKSFTKTTMKAVLEYLIEGTEIKLSPKMAASMVFEAVTFKNYTAMQVLEWIKDNYHVAVCFFFNELYVGWVASFTGATVKHRLNWNVVKDDALVFNTYTGSVVHIEGVSTNQDGSRLKKKASNVLRAGDVKQVKTIIKNDADMQAMANDKQLAENQKGYTGSITGFLVPYCAPGMATQIIDSKYSERNGKYFINSVKGSYSKSGGRQSIGIDFALSK
jgi:phage protein D